MGILDGWDCEYIIRVLEGLSIFPRGSWQELADAVPEMPRCTRRTDVLCVASVYRKTDEGARSSGGGRRVLFRSPCLHKTSNTVGWQSLGDQVTVREKAGHHRPASSLSLGRVRNPTLRAMLPRALAGDARVVHLETITLLGYTSLRHARSASLVSAGERSCPEYPNRAGIARRRRRWAAKDPTRRGSTPARCRRL